MSSHDRTDLIWHRVLGPEGLDDAMTEARDHAGPAMVEIVADPRLV